MLYLIVPTYGRLELTKQFLASINRCLGENYCAIVIDDKPPSYETFNTLCTTSSVKCLRGNGNLWWGGSINLGIDYLLSEIQPNDSDLCIFANNDVTINDSTFPVLAAAVKKTPDAIFHPRTFDPKGKEVSSGARVLSWFPYITRHPTGNARERFVVDLGTARFLLFTVKTLRKVGGINQRLPQYAGDNDFTLRAKSLGIRTYVVTGAVCQLTSTANCRDNPEVDSMSGLLQSFFSIRSPNSVKYRYSFYSSHFSPIPSGLIVLSMTFNSIAKFFLFTILRFSRIIINR